MKYFGRWNRAQGARRGEFSYCIGREGRVGMCWNSGNAVWRLLMMKTVLPILTAGRQRAWCARTLKHSVAHTQDADSCHDTIIYCPWLNTLLFRFCPYLKCIWICEMLPWVIARWQARPLQGVLSGYSTCFPRDAVIHLLTTITIQRRAVNPLNPELNPICYLLALLGAHHFLHVSRIRVKLLTL